MAFFLIKILSLMVYQAFPQVFYISIHLYDPEVAYLVTILMILSLLSYTISLSNTDQKGYILIVTAINVVWVYPR